MEMKSSALFCICSSPLETTSAMGPFFLPHAGREALHSIPALPTCASERGKLSPSPIILMDRSLYPTLDPGTTNSSSLFQNKVCIEGLGFSFSGCEKKKLPNKITLTAAQGVMRCSVTSTPSQGGLQTDIGQQCHRAPGQPLVAARPTSGETEHAA